MMKRFYIGTLCTLLVLLASCRSSKNVADKMEQSEWQTEEIISSIQGGTIDKQLPITAKVAFDFQLGEKGASVGGNLRMKRDDVIQLSLSAFFVEVGRIEFTPDYVLILDRMGKQYVKASYNEVSFLQRSGLDFYSLQALFWNELFLPGQTKVVEEKDFLVQTESSWMYLQPRKSEMIQLQFIIQAAERLLTETRIASRDAAVPAEFSWKYLHFDGNRMPDKMQMAISGMGKEVRMQMTLSNIRNNGDWNRTDVPENKYKQVMPEAILKKLM